MPVTYAVRPSPGPNPSRADIESRLSQAFLTLNQMAASQLTLERTGDVSDTLTTVARYLGCLKRDTGGAA